MLAFISNLFTKKTKINLEFCQTNLDRFLDEKQAEKYGDFLKNPRVSYKEYECLSECKLCKQSAYAKLNGTIVTANDSGDLLALLKEKTK
ncbi:DUF1450 domain-containing protein [Bacillus cihuensis]|uniref:DUF1450 domain-containing protein n=1 Tax=Bacillus cihuensis TaxID=1208599 RepID=UPI000402E7E8|nr:DUF1450 domain-containing protein [Bacillus cihuensis]